MKRIFGLVFGDMISNAFMVVGAVLLALALHLGVNPADGSVVDASVRGTRIPISPFIATIPAMVVFFFTGGGPISLALMYLAQIASYWVLGSAPRWLYTRFTET